MATAVAQLELAPNHKTGLPIKTPVLSAAGCWGFADEYADLVDFSQLGAFVTNPLTLRPRQPARAQCAIPAAGGVLVHTGLPNPGVRQAIRQFGGKWRGLPCPVVVHIAASSAFDTYQCVEHLEHVENVVGIELGFRDDENAADAEDMIAVAAGGLLPVIVRVPFMRAAEFARLAERAGATTLTVAAPPRGTVRDSATGSWTNGRFYGPAVFTQVLQLVRQMRQVTPLPLVACGGIHVPGQAQAMLAAGATALQLDSVVWAEPHRVNELLAACAD